LSARRIAEIVGLGAVGFCAGGALATGSAVYVALIVVIALGFSTTAGGPRK